MTAYDPGSGPKLVAAKLSVINKSAFRIRAIKRINSLRFQPQRGAILQMLWGKRRGSPGVNSNERFYVFSKELSDANDPCEEL